VRSPPCARAKHLASVARLGREVFSTLALIVDRTRPFAWASWAEEAGLETPEPKQVIELDTMSAVVRAAERGLGLALVPTPLCDSWLRSGALVRVFAVELATRDAYYLVSRPKDADRPQVKALTRWRSRSTSADESPSSVGSILFVCRRVHGASRLCRMTGVGDGVSYSIPLERMPRLPSAHPLEKNAPRGGGKRIAARSSEHGICSPLDWDEQGLCQTLKFI